MIQVDMSASFRSTSGKGAMRRLRMEGMTPAVVYGDGGGAVSLQLDSKILLAKLLKFYRRNTLVTLKIDGESDKSVVIGEVQTHPVRDTLIHVDFREIDLAKEHAFNVPVIYEGSAKGVDLGGVLIIHHQTVVIQGKPMDIPDECVLDVSELDIGESLKCGNIVITDNVKMITDPNASAVAVLAPGAKEVDEEVDGEEGEAVEGEAVESAEEANASS